MTHTALIMTDYINSYLWLNGSYKKNVEDKAKELNGEDFLWSVFNNIGFD